MNQALRNLTQAAFYADELRLFLDTHPGEQAVLDAYRAAARQAAQAKQALPYAVYALDAGQNDEWDWTCTPWPWELEE